MWVTPSTWYAPDHLFFEWKRAVASHLQSKEGWRAHGLGIAQKYIGEGIRLHVWNPSLSGFQEDETTHNHRFGFASHILHGEVSHTEVTLVPGGPWQKTSFTTTDEGVEVRDQGRVGIHSEHPSLLLGGNMYVFPAGVYHRSKVTELTVTVLEMGPKTGPSFAIFPPESVPRHAHGQVPKGHLEEVLHEAALLGKGWT